MSASRIEPLRSWLLRHFAGATQREQVLPQAAVAPSMGAEAAEPVWRQSSFELAYGLDVRDAEDTVPGELLTDLFGKPAN